MGAGRRRRQLDPIGARIPPRLAQRSVAGTLIPQQGEQQRRHPGARRGARMHGVANANESGSGTESGSETAHDEAGGLAVVSTQQASN
jgi:hypothetical protein